MIEKRGTGVTTYGKSLVAAAGMIDRPTLLLCAENETDGSLRKLSGALARGHALRAGPGRLEGFIGRDIFRRAHVHFGLRRRFMRLHPPLPFGIMHWTYPVPMRMEGWINIYTVHDLIPLLQPHLSPVKRSRHLAVMRELVAHADRIVTVSEAARLDIAAMFGGREARVVNCGQGVDISPADVASALPHGLRSGQYLLFCGAVEPRKNLHRLIDAHARSGTPFPLVIAGPDGWRAERIEPLIDRAQKVIRLGFLDRRELLALIRDARALLFPSLAEGFGLPVVEAMRLGTPVLTSSSGALAEVAADAALLVDPLDIEEIARGIGRISGDDVLLGALSRRGQIRSEAFSLVRFAARLGSVYEDAVAGYSPGDWARGSE